MERGTLNLIKGLGGALLREKIVAAASRRLAIIVDGAKLVDRLGSKAPVPVEVVTFGLEVTKLRLEALGSIAKLRLTPTGEPFVTDSGNRILDCGFGQISDPARLEERIGRIVGVVESGLFIGRADPVFIADASGVHRLDSPHAHRGGPPILVVMGVSGSGKTTVAQELAAKLGWPFEEGDALHPEANVAKMHAGIPLTDADRAPWLAAVAAWIDGQRKAGKPGIITCSALKRAYRDMIIGDRPAGAAGLSARQPGDHRPAPCRPPWPFHAAEPAPEPIRDPGGAGAGRGAHRGGCRPAGRPDRRGDHPAAGVLGHPRSGWRLGNQS